MLAMHNVWRITIIAELYRTVITDSQPVAYLGFWLGGLHIDRRPFSYPPSLPLCFPPPLPLSPPIPSPSPPLRSLEVGPFNPARGLGSGVSSPNGVWGVATAEIEFGAF